jgi:hypothetical protein
MNPTAKRILNIIGIASAVAVAVLIPIMSSLPSKWLATAGIIVGILSTLKNALGPAQVGAVPQPSATITELRPKDGTP